MTDIILQFRMKLTPFQPFFPLANTIQFSIWFFYVWVEKENNASKTQKIDSRIWNAIAIFSSRQSIYASYHIDVVCQIDF